VARVAGRALKRQRKHRQSLIGQAQESDPARARRRASMCHPTKQAVPVARQGLARCGALADQRHTGQTRCRPQGRSAIERAQRRTESGPNCNVTAPLSHPAAGQPAPLIAMRNPAARADPEDGCCAPIEGGIGQLRGLRSQAPVHDWGRAVGRWPPSGSPPIAGSPRRWRVNGSGDSPPNVRGSPPG